LLAMLVMFLAGSILAALAPNYRGMAIARIVQGVSSAACFGIAMTICAERLHDYRRSGERQRFASMMLEIGGGEPVEMFGAEHLTVAPVVVAPHDDGVQPARLIGVEERAEIVADNLDRQGRGRAPSASPGGSALPVP